MDNELYISTDEGILLENGEMFIPTSEDAMGLTASNGYLYWTERVKQGEYTLYASLGEFNTARQIDTITSYTYFSLAAARDGVATTSWSLQFLSIWSAMGPREDVENCPVERDNAISMIASRNQDLLWSNDDSLCGILGKNGPTAFDRHESTAGIAMDETNLYWAETSTEMFPSHVYRRPIRGGDSTLIATVGPVGSDFIVDGGSVFWKGDHRLERAPTSSKNDEGKETLACDVDGYAVSDDYVYWITPTQSVNGYVTMKMRR